MKSIFIICFAWLTLISINIHAEQLNTLVSANSKQQENIDSLSSIKYEFEKLKEKVDSLNRLHQSELLRLERAEEYSDSRVGWAISIMSIVFSIIIFGGGFLIYLTSIKPAQEILEKFNDKVDEKFDNREKLEIFNRINLAFKHLEENNFILNNNSRLILENLPYPLKEVYREEILKKIILNHIIDHEFVRLFDATKKYFFTVNDTINNHLAKYILNNKIPLEFQILLYVTNHYTDPKKITEIMLPVIKEKKELIWIENPKTFQPKFDDLFITLKKEELIIDTYLAFLGRIKAFTSTRNGKKSIRTEKDYKEDVQKIINGIIPENKNSYGYKIFTELFENEFDKLIKEE